MAKCVVCKKTTEYKQVDIGLDRPTFICKKCIPEDFGGLLFTLKEQVKEQKKNNKNGKVYVGRLI